MKDRQKERERRLEELWQYCVERADVVDRELDFIRMVIRLDDRFTEKEREMDLDLIVSLRDPTFYWNLLIVIRQCPELLKLLRHIERRLDKDLAETFDPISCLIFTKDESGSVH